MADAVTEAIKNLSKEYSSDDENSSIEDEDREYFREYFCVEDVFLSKDVSITVEGIGKLTFPLEADIIKDLINLSSKAKFGRGEKTLIDTTVRDTQMIPASMLKVEINEQALSNALERIGQGLNVNKNSTLVPHLYNMLIYGPGQFFKMHRDSEKIKNMVATLVVLLPSAYKGGDLVIQHNGRKHIFFCSKTPDLVKCVVFYSDCNHEIKRVTEGFRVTLTYNVILETPEVTISDVDVDENLNTAVDAYFSTPDQPKKIVYYLNHRYSKHSLRWNLLKGTDRTHAASLFAVAKKQGRIPCLALADYWEKYDQCGGGDECDLIDSEVSPVYWVDEHNLEFKDNSGILDSEVSCLISTTELLDPYKSESQPPTGNDGGTVDHWYRRACVVLWSNKWAFSHGYKQALHEIHELTGQKGNEKMLLDEINKVGKDFFKRNFWMKSFIIDMLFNITIYLNDKEIAVLILSKLPEHVLDKNRIDRFMELEQQYDEEIWIKITTLWEQEYSMHVQVLYCAEPFIEAYFAYTGKTKNSTVINFLLKEAVTNFIDSHKPQLNYRFSIFPSRLGDHNGSQYVYGRSNKGVIDKLCNILKICAVLENSYLQNKLIQHVISTPFLYRPVSVAELVFKVKELLHPDQFSHYRILIESALTLVSNQISQLSTNENDWHWPITIPCSCKFCSPVQRFFRSTTDTRVVIPAAKPNRRHVYSYLNPLSGQPVKFFTERRGSPYKIIIEKEPQFLKDRQTLLSDLIRLKIKLEEVTFADSVQTVKPQDELIAVSNVNLVEPVLVPVIEKVSELQHPEIEDAKYNIPAKRQRMRI